MNKKVLFFWIILIFTFSNLISQQFISEKEFKINLPNAFFKENYNSSINWSNNPILGDLKLLILLVYFNNTDSLNKPSQTIYKKIFDNNGAIQRFYHEASYGKVKLVGDLYGWIKINRSSENGDITMQEFYNIINNNDIILSNYSHAVVIHYMENYVEPMGWISGDYTFNDGKSYVAMVNLQNSYYFKNDYTVFDNMSETLIHELGHTFQLAHSGFYAKYDVNGNISYLNEDNVNEYGDFYDIMGGTLGASHFNSFFKEYLGWLTDSSCQFIDTTGVYELRNFRDFRGNRFAKVKYGNDPNECVYLEYRDLKGLDTTASGLCGPYGCLENKNKGLLLHAREPYFGFHSGSEYYYAGYTSSRIFLVDATPSDRNWTEFAINNNVVYIDKIHGFTIGPLVSMSDSVIRFNVEIERINEKVILSEPFKIDSNKNQIFEWSPNVGAEYYQLQISTSPYFDSYFWYGLVNYGDTNVISLTNIISNRIEVNLNDYYEDSIVCPYWRVRYKSNINGSWSPWSNPGLIIIEVTTGLNDNKNLSINFNLEQNYPNPFNLSTLITYSIPSTQIVTIKVYDILGNEITTLVNEEKPIGKHEIIFNAKNLSSGIYFYRMQTSDFTETKKFILMK